MRIVKASEVVKGMRVRVSMESLGVTTTVEGEVTQGWTQTNPCVIFADGSHKFLGSDHPVTVLAEPDPEWVEGAWYRIGGTVCIRKGRGFYTDAEDDDPRPDVEDVSGLVLGRVLIVDWPGDDEARFIEDVFEPGHKPIGGDNQLLAQVADAIRTQGGVR